mgnify:CR=1 FL=1
MGGTAKEIIAIQQRLEGDKSTYNNHCQEVARYVIPRLDEFFRTQITQGEKRTQWQYDSTAALALDRFSSIMNSVMTPRNAYWHGFMPEDDELLEDHEAMLWYEKVRNYLFKLRYGGDSNFAGQMSEVYESMGAFGCGVLIVEERAGKWARYKSSHIKEHHFLENSDGIIDTNYRKYELTARQAVMKFGLEALSPTIQNAYEKEPEKKFVFIHCVKPNSDRQYGRIDATGMAFSSYHVDVSSGELCAPVGGFRKFPFIPMRYITSTNEIYGRSPAMTALAEIKMLNQMRKTDIRARHIAVDPPVLAANELAARKVSLKPNAITYGGIDMAGRRMLEPWMNGSNLRESIDGIEQSRRMINDVFLVNLFQILIQTPEMTATEVMMRAQEKSDLLSPIGGRIESEFISRLIEREVDMMANAGLFDEDGPLPMPQYVRERGGAYSIEYTSPMARLRLSGEAAGAQRTLQALVPAAQIEPTVLDVFDFDKYADIIRRAEGAPQSMIRPKEQVDAIRSARAEQQQMQAMAQSIAPVAGAVKDIAQAQAIQ